MTNTRAPRSFNDAAEPRDVVGNETLVAVLNTSTEGLHFAGRNGVYGYAKRQNESEHGTWNVTEELGGRDRVSGGGGGGGGGKNRYCNNSRVTISQFASSSQPGNKFGYASATIRGFAPERRETALGSP
ncbi:hypothetical protein O1611_g3508 [Lasiodiplodia mahajangana]|uniref:Uncharacterized protein n=1 Tax=Lasiodiplodia mahajangana TaxID=1108764 RepID=A0ACC2JS83_9PEZI|nr:hypothetical protein O1611_g3508 [Lasiodiplodia mahajangana]